MKKILLISLLHTATTASSEPHRDFSLDEGEVGSILIDPDGTVINFPVKPEKVILGRKGSFEIVYIDNDLAVSALRPEATSNLFVYLLGRRFSFHLKVARKNGQKIITVHDRSGVPK